MDHFANWCGTSKEFFTGHWDVAHRLQLVYADVLKVNPALAKFLKVVDMAKSYCQGKDGLVFQELAYELKASYLTDKSEQTTRWVRSLLRMIEAYLRNLPTIYKMLGKLVEAARATGDLTEQKTLQQILDSIGDSYYICFGIGVAQMLDEYAKVSLDGQRLWNFPGSLVLSLEKLKDNLGKLEKDFHWSEEKLSLGSTGIPAMHINNLENGLFKQQLTAKEKRSAAVNLNLYKQTDYDHELDSEMALTANDIEEQEIGLIGLSPELKTKVERHLSNLCSDIKKGLDRRISISPVIKASVTAFHDTIWYDKNDPNVKNKAEQIVKELIDNLSIELNVQNVLPGYLSFLDFKQNFQMLRLEDIYQKFHEAVAAKEENNSFIMLFELVNIKSYSEAYCESVGSMNICVHKGRNLSAGNFSRELTFAFNSPSLHVLSSKFIPEIVEILINKKKMKFFRKLDEGIFHNKLKFQTVSASLGNYRTKSDKSTNLPLSFFS